MSGSIWRYAGDRSSERLSKPIATKGEGIDLFYITDIPMLEAHQRGVLQPVNAANISNMAKLYDFAKDPLGGGMCPAFTILGTGLADTENHFAAAPSSWTVLKKTDLKAPAAYPGTGVSYGPMMLITLSELNGGGIDHVEPGFKALFATKDRLQFLKRGVILESINQGDVSAVFIRGRDTPYEVGEPEGHLTVSGRVLGTNHLGRERVYEIETSMRGKPLTVVLGTTLPVGEPVSLALALDRFLWLTDRRHARKPRQKPNRMAAVSADAAPRGAGACPAQGSRARGHRIRIAEPADSAGGGNVEHGICFQSDSRGRIGDHGVRHGRILRSCRTLRRDAHVHLELRSAGSLADRKCRCAGTTRQPQVGSEW